MSQPAPSSREIGSAPATAKPESVALGALLGGGPENSDDQPTIISKTPATQSYINLNGGDSPPTSNIRGRTLAHFELLEPIGVGGMAAVLRARDKLLDRFVALKILPPEVATDPEHVQRFHQEARAAAKLDHENIARVYYCGEDQKLHFIAFEFVEGNNLRTVLERRGRVPVKEAVHYLLQIATGVAHAASRGVVHRDIKPSNIIIMPNGRAKLVDMGLARSLAPQDNRQLTQSGVTLGTFDYISPEQALEPRDADVRSDIYSLGCTFYQILTGQSPVPDGTAARKLHHHQYVAPIDPRQLNPEIPDEVAAILQRMMAKDPKDRYQRAEHLVQHLLQVAQKLGGEVPEGVFFVDAPLPGPPRKQPLVLAALGVAALGVFVLAVALTPPETPNKPLLRLPIAPVQSKDNASGKAAGAGAPKDTSTLPETRKVSTQKELADALGEDRSLGILLQEDLRLGDVDLVYKGGSNGKRTLTVESADAKKPVTLTFAYAPDDESNPWAGFLVEGGMVTFRNVQFAVEAGALTPRDPVAGVAVKAGQLGFYHCAFSQEAPEEDDLIARRNVLRKVFPVASVAAWSSRPERPPVLEFHQCYFAGGQAAVSIKGSATVKQDNCAFGPHACLFHVWGQQDKDNRAELVLSHVSAQVVQGPVFRLDDNANCAMDVKYSIFSCPSKDNSRDRPDLIRQTGTIRSVKYEGRRNAYYQLMSYWARPAAGTDDSVEGADWQTFKKRISLSGGADADVNSSPLKTSPWAKPNPGPDEPIKVAFQIDPKMPQLRQENDKKNRPIGVDNSYWGLLYSADYFPTLETTRPPETIVKLGPRERLVDPSATSGDRVYKKIEAAISEAEPDDVILIKYSGELKIEPTALTENRRVKLKPYADSQPILVLGNTTDKTAALFHLHHSQIEFEQMEFVLRPDANHRWLSVVSMGADSTCRFDHCVITLDSAENSGFDLDVVAMLDPHETIKTGVQEPKARADVKFKSCFVRGRGDLIGVQANRPFDLQLDSSVVCLAGSLLTVHNNGDTIAGDARINVRLQKTTTYLTNPVFQLASGKTGRGILTTNVTANNCLFAAGAGKPFVRLDGPENESQLAKALRWSGNANAFESFDKLMEVRGSDTSATVVYQNDEWRRFTDAGADTRVDRMGWQPAIGVDSDFAQLLPRHFNQRPDDLLGYGATSDQLPRPAGDFGSRRNNNKPH